MKISDLPLGILSDSYKAGHFKQYPDNVTSISAYGCFRKALRESDQRIVFYGMDYILKNYIEREWTHLDIDMLAGFFSTHNVGNTPYPFPEKLFRKIANSVTRKFPIEICTLPEGSVVYPHMPVYTMKTNGEFAPLCTFLETLLTMVWYPSTVATTSRHIKTIIQQAFDKSVEPESHWLINSRLHDFGFRGCTSVEQSVIGGVAHLLNFEGSDTMSAAFYAQYELNGGKPVATSIPATEHSVMMSWHSEKEAVGNMMNEFGSGIYATVADTYNWDRFLNELVPSMVGKANAKGGLWVVRPDSGNPVQCVVEGLEALAKVFPVIMNSKGYKVIQGASIIQGDGIGLTDIETILNAVMEAGFSAQNVAFGCGAGLLQKCNRDTLGFATKVSQVTYKLADGTFKIRDICKVPKTNPDKASLPGLTTIVVEEVNNMSIPHVFSQEYAKASGYSWNHPALKCSMYNVYSAGTNNNRLSTRHVMHGGKVLFKDIKERLEADWVRYPKLHDSISQELKNKQEAFRQEMQ